MATSICFVNLLWGPFETFRPLGKIPTFGAAAPTAPPNPSEPLLLCGYDPKDSCKSFFKVL